MCHWPERAPPLASALTPWPPTVRLTTGTRSPTAALASSNTLWCCGHQTGSRAFSRARGRCRLWRVQRWCWRHWPVRAEAARGLLAGAGLVTHPLRRGTARPAWRASSSSSSETMASAPREVWLLGRHYGPLLAEDADRRWGRQQRLLRHLRSRVWFTYRTGMHAHAHALAHGWPGLTRRCRVRGDRADDATVRHGLGLHATVGANAAGRGARASHSL
jgi:hypothetical protein